MQKWLTSTLFTFTALVFSFVVQAAHLPQSDQQKQLDEKLLSAFSGRRGQCPDLAKVRNLIQRGASANARNWDGNTLTVLMLAAQNGCTDIAELLLDAKADVNAKASVVIGVGGGASGITSLSQAAASGNAPLVKMLIEHGADLHALTGNGATGMAFATTNEVVKELLDRGLEINARDKDGYTILILSAEGFYRPTVAYLLGHGADPNATAKDGTTALKLAEKIGRSDDVELLRKAGAKE